MVHSADSLCSKVEQSLSIYLLSELSETFPLQGSKIFQFLLDVNWANCWKAVASTAPRQWHVQARRLTQCRRMRVQAWKQEKPELLSSLVSPLRVYAFWFSLIAYLYPIFYHYFNTILRFNLVLIMFFSLILIPGNAWPILAEALKQTAPKPKY